MKSFSNAVQELAALHHDRRQGRNAARDIAALQPPKSAITAVHRRARSNAQFVASLLLPRRERQLGVLGLLWTSAGMVSAAAQLH